MRVVVTVLMADAPLLYLASDPESNSNVIAYLETK